MGITIAETNGVVVNLIQQKLDGKLLPSVFQARAVSKNRSGIITKDMWYKIHPSPTVLFVNAFISARRQEPTLLSQTTDTTGTTGKTNEVLARGER